MSHFEQLMIMFQSHENEDGSTGFTIDKVTTERPDALWTSLNPEMH